MQGIIFNALEGFVLENAGMEYGIVSLMIVALLMALILRV
jgi:hypothetical protein